MPANVALLRCCSWPSPLPPHLAVGLASSGLFHITLAIAATFWLQGHAPTTTSPASGGNRIELTATSLLVVAAAAEDPPQELLRMPLQVQTAPEPLALEARQVELVRRQLPPLPMGREVHWPLTRQSELPATTVDTAHVSNEHEPEPPAPMPARRRPRSRTAARPAVTSLASTPSIASPDEGVQTRHATHRKVYSPTPVYPPEALQARSEGKVKVRVRVGADGRVQSADIYRSSGFPALDRAALTAVRKWRFEPSGEEAVFAVPIVFVIEETTR